MKFLILVIIITWSFGGGYQNTPEIKNVSSPEAAAILVWKDQKTFFFQAEPDQKEYKLYEADITTGKIKEIGLPTVVFKSEPTTETLEIELEEVDGVSFVGNIIKMNEPPKQ